MASEDTEPKSSEEATGSTETAQHVAQEPAKDSAAPADASSESQGAGQHAAADRATADDGAEDHEADDDSEGAYDSAEASGGEESGEGKKKKRRRRKKKKKPAEGETRASDRTPFHVGEEVFGKVTAVLETAIMVDLAGKALAIFDRGEMEQDDLVPAVGDRFVGQVLTDGGRGGLVVLTRKPLREEEAKPRVEQALKDGTLVHGLVTGVIKGGLDVMIDGLRAFAPASGVDLHPQNANLTQLVGQRLDFKVTQFEKGGRDVVVTRRPMLEKEAHERRKKALEVLQEGAEMEGVVRTVVEWGAFVALPEAENLEGLVHISEASHDPRQRIADVLKAGDRLKVKILKIDEKGKIWLSRKALIEDPWATLTEKVKPGEEIEGVVSKVEPFGVVVALKDELEGFCHISDLSFERVDDASKVAKVGDALRVVVNHIDPRSRRISLHPALPPERAEEPKQRVSKNANLQVVVVKTAPPGLQVRVLGATGRNARGFIPAGQTGTPRGTDLAKHFKLGTQLEAKVIDFDPKRGEPKLSIVKLAQDEERRATKEYRQKLKTEAHFGTLGDLLKSKLGGG
jgi:small subunit ribosomal protein S1